MRPPEQATTASDGGVPCTRRQILRSTGVAGAAGLAGCTGMLDGPTDGTDRECTAAEPATSVSEYATHPRDDVTMFQRGLRRLGYYPDETVPESPTVNWEFPINFDGHTAAKSSPVPTPDGETIMIAGDKGRVDARSPNGKLQWTVQTGATNNGFHASPTIVGKTAYLGGYDGDMYAFDVPSGEMVWHTPSEELDGATAIGSSAAYYDGTLYAISEFWNPSRGALWAFDAETGEPTWKSERMWGQPHPSPTIDLDAGRILAGSNDGAVYCWAFPSLEFEWKFQAGPPGGPKGETKGDGAFNLGAQIKGTVAAHDGYGYVCSWDSRIYCLDLEDGTEVWSFDTGDVTMANPAVDPDEGIVYTGSDSGNVFALDAETGEELWATDVGGRVIGGLTVTAGTVLAGSYDSHLYALDKETGGRCWRVENRGRVTSAAVPVDGRVYYAERAVVSGYYDDDEKTVMEAPGHAYCLVEDD